MVFSGRRNSPGLTRCALVGCTALVLLAHGPASAETSDRDGYSANWPFAPGEVLNYVMEWTFLDLAEVSVGVTSEGSTTGAWKIEMSLRSTGIVERMGYAVRDTITSVVDRSTLLPSRFQNRGYYIRGDSVRRRDSLYLFEQGSRIVHEGGGMRPCSVTVRDFLSGTYWLRAASLDDGRRHSVRLHSRATRDPDTLTVVVRRRETIRVPAGRFPCVVLERVDSARGGSPRRTSGMSLWLTDDARRMPVRVEFGRGVRRMTLELTSVGRGSG